MYFFLKLYVSASMHAPGRETGIPIIEPEEIRAAVRVAQNYNTYVAIHCHGARAIDNAVRAGVHTVEHASMISEETLQKSIVLESLMDHNPITNIFGL